MTSQGEKTRSDTVIGVVYAASAFLIWGISPIYWKALRAVPAFEIILHRMVWSFFFLVPLILVMRRWKDFIDALKNYRSLLTLLFTALIIGANWLLYIWAVNNDNLLQASLGYYISPLVNVVLGMVSPCECGAGNGFSERAPAAPTDSGRAVGRGRCFVPYHLLR
jgi:chloramphenicol-sensitive protein RarD